MPSVSLVDPSEPSSLARAEAVVIGVVPGPDGPGSIRLAPGAAPVAKAIGGNKLLNAIKAVGASGTPDEVTTLATFDLAAFPVVIATGVGDNARDAEALRRAVGAAIRSAGRHARVHVAIDGPSDALTEGAVLGSYAFTDYKSSVTKPALRAITIAGSDGAGLRKGKIVAEAVTRVRDLVNTPPNDLYPATFADRVVELAEGTARVEVEVLDERALKRGKYGAMLAVGSGSSRPPRLVRIAYTPSRPVARLALVGKGITFDSGGLNLKTAMMEQMKSDMGGGAAVAAAALAVAALRLPVEVVATVAMAENMPSGTAYRPSDVITMRSGLTVEIGNTDAEGRLVLADALSRAAEDEPDYLIEASTLTGAQLVALGSRVIGAMGEPAWRDRVVAAGNKAGEASWAMPLPDELRGGLDSTVADLANVAGDRWGGMLTAGHFLARFMPKGLPWVHLDIAGPAFNTGGAHGYTSRGGTGAAVRTIVAVAEDLAMR